MNPPPLNPDVVDRVAKALMDDAGYTWEYASEKFRNGFRHHAHIALAAALPEVTSVEELEALPNGSVILPLAYHTTVAVALRDQYGTWAVAGHPGDYSTEAIFLGMHGLPARVLYRPEVNDA